MVAKLLKEHVNYPAALTKLITNAMSQIFIINSLPVGLASYGSCLIYMLYAYMISNFKTFKQQIWLRIFYIHIVNYLSYLSIS